MLALPYSLSLIIHVYILFTYHLRPERDYHINPLLNVKFILVCLRWQLKAKHRSIMTRVYNMDLYDPLPLLYQWLHYWTSLTGLSLGRREWNIKDFSSKPGEECLPSVRRQPAVSHSEVGWRLWQFCAGTSLLTLFWTCKWMATGNLGIPCWVTACPWTGELLHMLLAVVSNRIYGVTTKRCRGLLVVNGKWWFDFPWAPVFGLLNLWFFLMLFLSHP